MTRKSARIVRPAPPPGPCQSRPERVARALFRDLSEPVSEMHAGPPAPIAASAKNAPVAQLDRALDYESRGQEFESLRARHSRILCDIPAWPLPRSPDAASSRIAWDASSGRASDIFNGDVPGLVFLPGPNLDRDMIAKSGQKAHQPFEGNFGEFSSEDFRQFGLSGSYPPCGGASG
jgi:hypothetical protein